MAGNCTLPELPAQAGRLPAQAWTVKTLYTFTSGGDGNFPWGLVRNATTGDLHGTTVNSATA
jgi:hypothetical protein